MGKVGDLQFQTVCPTTKISCVRFLRPKVPHLTKPERFQSDRQTHWVKETQPRFVPAAAAALAPTNVRLFSSSRQDSCKKYSNTISLPGAAAATARKVSNTASSVRNTVTPSHEKKVGNSGRCPPTRSPSAKVWRSKLTGTKVRWLGRATFNAPKRACFHCWVAG